MVRDLLNLGMRKEAAMFERILVPLDGSKRAERILAECGPILDRPGSRIFLLRVPDTPGVYPSAEISMDRLRKTVLEEAESYLARMKEHLEKRGLNVTTMIREGNPAERILEESARWKISLVLMSTHGRTGVRRWVFGSVTEKVIRAAEAPVLIYRSFPERDVLDTLTGMKVDDILLPIDESNASMKAVPYAARLAAEFGAGVHVLHVVDREQARAPATRHVGRAVRELTDAGVVAAPVERTGNAAAEILDACHDLGAGLIVLTTHGRSGVSRWTCGSVTEKVLRAAETPLLIVRTSRSPARAEAEASRPETLRTP